MFDVCLQSVLATCISNVNAPTVRGLSLSTGDICHCCHIFTVLCKNWTRNAIKSSLEFIFMISFVVWTLMSCSLNHLPHCTNDAGRGYETDALKMAQRLIPASTMQLELPSWALYVLRQNDCIWPISIIRMVRQGQVDWTIVCIHRPIVCLSMSSKFGTTTNWLAKRWPWNGFSSLG
jgi:hypothetical protein